MELFHKRKNLILFPIFLLLSLVINVDYAQISYDYTPKEKRHKLGEDILFSLKFTGRNEKDLQDYNSMTVFVAPKRDSKSDDLIIIYSFPVLKKPGMKRGNLRNNHPFYRQISDIKTVKSTTTQTFSMKMRMVCRLSTNFKFVLFKDSKTFITLGESRLNSYSVTSLGIDKKRSVYYPGDKIKVNCQINKCNNLDTDKNSLKHDKFLLTSQEANIQPINSSAIVTSYHDHVIDTKFDVSKDFVVTCVPLHISCTLDNSTWTTRRSITPDADRSFCLNERTAFRVKWSENNYTDNLNYVTDGAIFTTICTAFTPKEVNMVSEGEPAKVVSRVTLNEKTQNVGEFAVQQLTTFRNDDTFCYYPRKTFRCYLNDSEEAGKAKSIYFRPIECEPKFLSFKPKKKGDNKLNLNCIIRKTREERINKTGIVDDNQPIEVHKHLSNKTDHGRNRNEIVMDSEIPFSKCDNLISRNLTCWYYYDGTVFTTGLDLSELCAPMSYYWLLYLLLLLLIPLLILCCCLCWTWCRRNKERLAAFMEKTKKEEKETKEEKKETKEEEKETKEKEKETKVKEKKVKEKVKEEKMKEKKKEVKEKKKEGKPKPTDAKRIEARRMYRMFKKRRPFGWRELNDHFLWLSMMAQDEEHTRSLSPSYHQYAQFRLMKKRTRFGNRELLSFSQTLMQQGVRTEEDLATLRDLESCYGNWSQLTVSPDPSKNEADTEAKKDAHRQQMLSDMYNEGAIGCYNQLESYKYIHEEQNPEVKIKKSESSDSSSDKKSEGNNYNQQPPRRRRKRKHRRSSRHDDMV